MTRRTNTITRLPPGDRRVVTRSSHTLLVEIGEAGEGEAASAETLDSPIEETETGDEVEESLMTCQNKITTPQGKKMSIQKK